MSTSSQRAKWRKSANAKYARRRAAGLCITCGRKAQKGRATCENCSSSATQRNRDRRAAITSKGA